MIPNNNVYYSPFHDMYLVPSFACAVFEAQGIRLSHVNYPLLNFNIYILVLDVTSVCSFAIETTFPFSNFNTKHTFGILMTLRKFLSYGAPQAPHIFFF